MTKNTKSKSTKLPSVKSKYEFMVFLEFIEKATGWERGKYPDRFHSKNGIDGIVKGEVDICVQSYGDCYWHFDASTNIKRVFICLGDKRNEWQDCFSDGIDYKKEIILGVDFIKKLALSHMELWWLFVASCSKNCRVIVGKNGERLILIANKYPLIYDIINVVPSIEMSKITLLSHIFEEDFIYRRKRAGETYVVVGNGVSIPFGSDLWPQLSDYLFDYLKPQYVENGELVKSAIGGSTFSTTSLAKTIINPDKYYAALHSCIYRKYEDDMHSDGTLLRAITLSKLANENLKIISYNYDEFLEIDYNKCCKKGLEIKPVYNAIIDEKTSEPKIMHVHGFISLDGSVKSNLVLTQEEYYKIYKNNSWVVKTQVEALNKHCLYVGSSMSDLFQMSIIDKVRDSYYKRAQRYFFTYPWNCYALLCLKGLKAKDIATIYTYYLNKGIRIIFVSDFDQLPKKYSDLMS